MRLSFKLLPLFLLFVFGASASDVSESVTIQFYSENITMTYDKEMMVSKKLLCASDKCLKKYHETMKAAPHKQLLDQLIAERERLHLNDWLYAKLVRATVEKIYRKKKMAKSLAWWFFLCESGYDIRVTFIDNSEIFLFVPSDDHPIKMSSFTEKDQKFYNLSSVILGVNTRGYELKKPKFKGNPKGKAFTFNLKTLPTFKAAPSPISVNWKYKEEEIKWRLKIDQTALMLMKDYLTLSDMAYVETPVSATLANSLLPKLKKMIKGKSQKESLEVLVAFTRSAFNYKWDWDVYNADKPMYAEQVFDTEFSDHEDRCALLYYLVKELLDLPMIAITHYNNNMTLGVIIDEEMKRKYEYNGRNYTICDPTHPVSSCEINRYPNGLTYVTATVVGEYK